MKARIALALLLGVLAWFAPSIARAQTCVVFDTAIAFGTFDPTAGTAKAGQSTVHVGCRSSRVLVTITLGTGQSNSYANRVMTSTTGGSLTYNLYTSATFGTVWGDGITGGTGSVQCTTGNDGPGECTGKPGMYFTSTYPVYGRIDAVQPNAVVGAYTDDVVVTVTF